MKRTDMACDFLPHDDADTRYVRSFTVTVDGELSRKLNRPQGKYCTVESRAVPERRRDCYAEMIRCLGGAIRRLSPRAPRRVLVAGLGNPGMTADSLGAKTCEYLTDTKRTAGESSLCVVLPNVIGVTGIESFDVVAGVAARVSPDLVIAVDSLASAAVSRIASAFQVTDTGITPGSGVSNHRQRMCAASLGVPVLSVGVPLVVYASTIIEDATGRECPAETADEIGRMVVTPKDIDLYVRDCAEILATSIVTAFEG